MIFHFWGINELSARLFPLLCGVLLLWVFYDYAKQFLSPLPLLLAMSFLSFDRIFIDYSTQCKQYSSDALVTVGLLWVTQKLSPARFTTTSAGIWLLIGSISIWLSMPSVFVLSGVGLYYVLFFIKNKNYIGLAKFVAVSLIWLLQFALYFLWVLKSDAQSSNLQSFHSDYFFTFPPKNIAQIALLGKQLNDIVSNVIGRTFIALMLSTLGLVAGIVHLWRNNKPQLCLLLVPILLTLLASALHYYSIIGRLTLFFLPALLLVIFIGYDKILPKSNPIVTLLLCTLFVSTLTLQVPLIRFFQPFRNDYAQLRDGLAYIEQEKQPQEALFVYHNAAPVVYYYQKLADRTFDFDKLTLQAYRCCDADIIQQDLTALRQKGEKRIWILYDQPDSQFLLDYIAQQQGKILKKQYFYRTLALLYELP
jgi:hypothetical protein